jgi:hypothetical protein
VKAVEIQAYIHPVAQGTLALESFHNLVHPVESITFMYHAMYMTHKHGET